jgi:hypothetical protein
MANELTCAHCGKPAAAHELERFFIMPDAVCEIPKAERPGRVILHDDLCMLDKERCFVRGVLYLPMKGAEKEFGIGFWVEIEKDVFMWYCEHFSEDLLEVSPSLGKLANELETSASWTLGLDVLVRWGEKTKRPRFVVTSPMHELYRDQQKGITLSRAHQLMGALLAS